MQRPDICVRETEGKGRKVFGCGSIEVNFLKLWVCTRMPFVVLGYYEVATVEDYVVGGGWKFVIIPYHCWFSWLIKGLILIIQIEDWIMILNNIATFYTNLLFSFHTG